MGNVMKTFNHWGNLARTAITMGILLSTLGCYNLLPKLGDAKLASYGGSQSNDNGLCGPSASSVYSSSVLPYLRANCSGCHSTTTPTFTIPDANLSYSTSKNYLNTAMPAQSLIYVRATDGHCGSADCQKSGAELLPGVQAWASAEVSAAACPTAGDPNGIANEGVMLRLNGTLQQVLSSTQQAGLCTQYEVAFVRSGVAATPSKDLLVRLSGAATFSDAQCQTASPSVTIVGSTLSGGPATRAATYFYVMEPAAGDKVLLGTITGYQVGFSAQLSILPAPAPSPTPAPSPSPTPRPSPSPSPSPRPSPSPSPSPRPSPSPSPVPSPSPSPTPVATPCSTLQKQNAYAATVWPLAKANCATCHTTGSKPQFGNATLSTAYGNAKPLVTITSASSSRLYSFSKNGHCGNCTATTGANFLAQMNLWFPAETTNNCSALTTPH